MILPVTTITCPNIDVFIHNLVPRIKTNNSGQREYLFLEGITHFYSLEAKNHKKYKNAKKKLDKSLRDHISEKSENYPSCIITSALPF
jgi:hypothetical protein